MVNLNKYNYNGWTLSKDALRCLSSIIIDNKLNRAIEFGSGESTYFLNDIGIDYLSFDNDVKFAAKSNNVVVKSLVELDDIAFNEVITGKVKFVDICYKFQTPNKIHTRQRNCFYKINKDDISGKFDLVILDGPNGNGRSIAFDVIQDHMDDVCFIFIDDYNHYPFVDIMYNFFNSATLIKSNNVIGDMWELYKIEKI